MTLTISVITPSFQQGQFIERTIQSVINQRIGDLEYVICDGGSSDNTLTILQSYSGTLNWISEPDQGQAHAVNKGLAMTKGDIIAWINSDDIYYPQALKYVIDFFTANPNISAVYGQADWIDENNNIIAPYPTQDWNYKHLTKECYLCQPTVFFRRSLVERLGNLDTSLHYCMDYELWLRYGQIVPFIHVPIKLAGSRLYVNNKTFSGRLAAHREANHMLKAKLGYATQHWIFEYSRLQIENVEKFDKKSDFKITILLLLTAIKNCWILNKKSTLIVILKVLIYQLFSSNYLVKTKPHFDIEGIILNQKSKS